MFLDQGNSEQRQPGVTCITSLCCTHTTGGSPSFCPQLPRPLIMLFAYREPVSGFHRVHILRTSYTDASLRHCQPASSFIRGRGCSLQSPSGKKDSPPPQAHAAAAAQARAITPNSPIQPLQGRGRGSRRVFSKCYFYREVSFPPNFWYTE